MKGIGNRHNQHSFATIPDVNIGRSQFDRSYSIKDTFDFDYLIPIYLDEIVPGDTFNVTLSAFGRLATQIVPIMDNMYIDYFFFFVPNRLTYEKWEQLNGATIPNPDSTTDYIMPQLTAPAVTGFAVDTVYDKFGLPTGVPSLLVKNSVPLRCYNLIWNEWFRDENLQNSIINNVDQGPDDPTDYVLKKRGKRHDYFTSALPWPQKGPAVTLPLGTSAPVKTNATALVTGANPGLLLRTTSGTIPGSDNSLNWGAGAGGLFGGTGAQSSSAGAAYPSNLYADLNTATAATINQLRQAFMMQSLFELDARGGTRYVEILKSHFGVISPDFRLQRPEYLGGGSSRINSHPVAQTAPTTGTDAQGQLAAFATTSATSRDNIGFTKSFVEHGYVIGLACARADITYQQGLNRLWDKSTRYDFFWPKLQELGEQAILNKEIYAQGTSADNDVFGYQERYAEYRYRPSEIHGRFRSTYTTPLDMWHLAQEFSSLPALNTSFIEQNTPIERAIAVDTEPDILFDAFFKVQASRPMLAYSVPATIGRF